MSAFGPLGWIDEGSDDSDALTRKKGQFLDIRDRMPDAPHGVAELIPLGPIGPHEPNKWKPISFLGRARCGTFSLWEYISNEVEMYENRGRWVVLKTENAGAHDQTEEGLYMDKLLTDYRSDHLVSMVYRGEDYHKLYLEYCIKGDLQVDIQRRQEKNDYYSEKHLWRMFLCLVKGIMSLDGEHLRQEGISEPQAILHFDLKPANIFIGEAEDTINPDVQRHTCRGGHNVLKIGDFGDAWPLQKPDEFLFSPSEIADKVKDRGTKGYYPPEQQFLIDENPNYDVNWVQWSMWERDYGYTTKANIWGIGAIMWQLVCLNEKSPKLQGQKDGHNEYRHTFNRTEPDFPETAHTYGRQITHADLKARYPLRDSVLIDLVLLCLSDFPAVRPTSKALFDYVSNICFEYDTAELVRSPKLPDSVESEDLPPSSDGAKRQYSPIPFIVDRHNPLSSGATPPVSPNSALPADRTAYGPPSSPSQVKAAIGTAASTFAEGLFGKSSPRKTPSPGMTPPRKSPRKSPTPRTSPTGSTGPLRPQRRAKLSSFFCIPCQGDLCSSPLWIVFFVLALWSTGFCLFYTMLVDHEQHL